MHLARGARAQANRQPVADDAGRILGKAAFKAAAPGYHANLLAAVRDSIRHYILTFDLWCRSSVMMLSVKPLQACLAPQYGAWSGIPR